MGMAQMQQPTSPLQQQQQQQLQQKGMNGIRPVYFIHLSMGVWIGFYLIDTNPAGI